MSRYSKMMFLLIPYGNLASEFTKEKFSLPCDLRGKIFFGQRPTGHAAQGLTGVLVNNSTKRRQS